jgi:YidC/Oxa1 family membrane protein insertase
MFDWLFEAVAGTLSFFYDLTGDYGLSIALLTLAAMVITTPLTLKGTRSMMQMQLLQPEMKRLQLKYKDDRQKLNEELMAFYKANNLNPLGGCLPLLAQAPIFIILFNVVRGLTRLGDDGTFDPKYLDQGSDLFLSLDQVDQMRAFGFDLAESASVALGIGFVHALPHVLMVAVVAVTAYYQQKQIQGRNPNAEVPPQMKIMMRVFPAMFVVFAFVSPGGLVVYFVTSNLYRIGLQGYITRTLYRGEDSMGAKAAAASKAAKDLKEDDVKGDGAKGGNRTDDDEAEEAAAGNGDAPEKGTKGGGAKGGGAKGGGGKAAKGPAKGSSNGTGGGPARPTSRTGAQNRSKKKKKRR